jgi:[NiFe] hydrogenase diaphorase moiety large subunit
VVCNADEGEPGTFKDRVLLNVSAHAIFEGMTVCAAVIGADKGLLYLRGEYAYLLDHLHEVLEQRRHEGLLGKDILGKPGFNFDIEIHSGAGAYICGEESALIESLEGKRGVPRIRPPFPVTSGYKNQPTVVNNVETFWSVSCIMQQGSDWFKQSGTEQSTGTRLLSISGDCETPGIYEFPFGVSVHDIVRECGGTKAQAVQIGGAAGTTVLAHEFDRYMSYEDLSTGGSFMVIGPERKLLDVLDNFADFFRHESCGFCTPCRIGTSLIADLLKRFNAGQASEQDRQQLKEIALLMQQTSFCGLGTSAPTAILNALDQNAQLFDQAIIGSDQNPVFNLDAAITEARQLIQDPDGEY